MKTLFKHNTTPATFKLFSKTFEGPKPDPKNAHVSPLPQEGGFRHKCSPITCHPGIILHLDHTTLMDGPESDSEEEENAKELYVFHIITKQYGLREI